MNNVAGIALAIISFLCGVSEGRRKERKKGEKKTKGSKLKVRVDSREEYNIAGINHRGLDDSALGDFTGTVRCDYDNAYDDTALAVYTDTGLHLGYLPKGQEVLFDEIDAAGGEVPCDGTVGKSSDGRRKFYVGVVRVNQQIVSK